AWRIIENVDWLRTDVDNGTISDGMDQVLLICDRYALNQGSYAAEISIVSEAGVFHVSVSMTVPEEESDITSALSGCASNDDNPFTVQFYDESEGEIAAWEWIFGDGGVSYEQNPAHTFLAEGEYTVALTVTGEDGTKGTTIKKECVRVGGCPLDADFIANPLSGSMPHAVQFSNQSDGPVAIYAWDFGDGSTSDERDPAHTYIAAGTYSVTLTVSGA
ncbi:MAG: PKD domain-containing protein, partial [Deltaproteobacteria bacterium]|nr:PKD domain-containing protein [Deltaproteobacteria bacterium]